MWTLVLVLIIVIGILIALKRKSNYVAKTGTCHTTNADYNAKMSDLVHKNQTFEFGGTNEYATGCPYRAYGGYRDQNYYARKDTPTNPLIPFPHWDDAYNYLMLPDTSTATGTCSTTNAEYNKTMSEWIFTKNWAFEFGGTNEYATGCPYRGYKYVSGKYYVKKDIPTSSWIQINAPLDAYNYLMLPDTGIGTSTSGGSTTRTGLCADTNADFNKTMYQFIIEYKLPFEFGGDLCPYVAYKIDGNKYYAKKGASTNQWMPMDTPITAYKYLVLP